MSTRAAVGGFALAGLLLPVVALAPASAADVERAPCELGQTTYIDERGLSNALPMISTPQSWELATGKGITVAVVDSGVNVDNAHFVGDTVVPGRSLLPDDDGRSDDQGHGTSVAGVIAAQKIPESVLEGQAYDAKILPVRVYDLDQENASGTPPQLPLNAPGIAQGIRVAADAGAQIINVSLSSGPTAPGLEQMETAVRYAQRQGALIVASAGDSPEGRPVEMQRYPASFDGVIGVAAANTTGRVDDFSIHHEGVDVIAPGQNVIVAFHANGDCLGGADPQTSYSAGFVSGLAAQLMEAYPEESNEMIAWRIMSTAKRDRPSLRDDREGWGLIQPLAALSVVPDASRPGPPLPGAEAQEAAPVETGVEIAGQRVDPLTGVRREAVWWSLGAVGIAGLGLLLRPWSRRRG